MRPPGILVSALLLGFFCSRPVVAEEQLPINELDACEIVDTCYHFPSNAARVNAPGLCEM
jgi:hypothetical protein